jgi:hypothetical protein
MTTHRSPQKETGHSSFAEKGISHEERMPDDDSAETFAESSEDGRAYGSGGSYGYGGAFEHDGQRGYDVAFSPASPVDGRSDRYEAQGKFGRDTEGYEREGLGHPGKDEKRPADAPTQADPSSARPQDDDARKGYSQDSGYAQSGGSPAPGGKADKKKVSRKSN